MRSLILSLAAMVALVVTSVAADRLLGDMNNDGRADAVDALLILQGAVSVEPLVGGDLTEMELPPILTVNRTGCATDGECLPGNAYGTYRADLLEVVVRASANNVVLVHELCHAHQHLAINGGATTGTPWHEWDNTDQGQSYQAAALAETGPWAVSKVGNTGWLENFAGNCANWYLSPYDLRKHAPVTYDWFKRNMP